MVHETGGDAESDMQDSTKEILECLARFVTPIRFEPKCIIVIRLVELRAVCETVVLVCKENAELMT